MVYFPSSNRVEFQRFLVTPKEQNSRNRCSYNTFVSFCVTLLLRVVHFPILRSRVHFSRARSTTDVTRDSLERNSIQRGPGPISTSIPRVLSPRHVRNRVPTFRSASGSRGPVLGSRTAQHPARRPVVPAFLRTRGFYTNRYSRWKVPLFVVATKFLPSILSIDLYP